jgi:hypothetical protein
MLVPLVLAATAGALPEQNLIPNPEFREKPDMLKGWRYTYPHQQQQYGRNQNYVKAGDFNGKRCVEFSVPLAQGNMGGAMLETAFIKCEPGATYKTEVEACPKDTRMMIMIESWIELPPEIQTKPRLRVWPAEDGRPQLMMCARSRGEQQHGSNWRTVRETFTVPKTVDLNVNGNMKPTPPSYISVKVYVDVPNVKGKPISNAYVTNFRLTKVK